MFFRSLPGLLSSRTGLRLPKDSQRCHRDFRPEVCGLEPRIALSDTRDSAYEIVYLGNLGPDYTGPIQVYVSGGTNPIDAAEWANYQPPAGYTKNTTRNLQFNSSNLISSPNSTGYTYITTSDGYTWLYLASAVNSMWPFNPAAYPGEDYTSGYEAAALDPTPPPGEIKWADNNKNQDITWDARTADGKPIERYFIRDPWGNLFIMQASGETDPSKVRSNFFSAVLPPGWTLFSGYLKKNLTITPAYNSDGTANFNMVRDSADDAFHQITWGELGWGTAQMIAGMPIWGGTNGDTIRTSTEHDNVVYAAGGHDTIYANGPTNTIYGDGGTDTAVFPGRRSAYTISSVATSDGSATVVTRHGSAASTEVTTLYDIEHIRFTGGKVCMAYLSREPRTRDVTADDAGKRAGGHVETEVQKRRED